MEIVSVEELVTQKILAFDLYNENGEKIMSAGEFLTPGKLLQLHHISTLYKEGTYSEPSESYEDDVDEEDDDSVVIREEIPLERDEPESIIESFEDSEVHISQKSQKDITKLFTNALDEAVKKESEKTVNLCMEARDKIVEQVLPIVNDIVYKSQLKIQGDYNYAHGINVSMLSTALASRLGFNEDMIRDIALGAMLCDIGKSRIPPQLFEKARPTNKEIQVMRMHTIIGYKILKEEMGLPDYIAKIALEHHERNDGSGYPYGISGEFISPAAQVVMVCDVYDDLTSRKGPVAVKNSKEAVKVMMELGSKWFAPNVLYSFVYMSNFNDLTPT